MNKALSHAAIVCLAAAALAFASPAQARTNTLEGSFRGDPDASIELALKLTRAGEPTRVTRITYAGIDAYCPDGGITQVAGTTRGHRVRNASRGQRWFSGGGLHSEPLVNIFAHINGRGTRAHGSLALIGEPSTTCLNGPGPSLAKSLFLAVK